MGAFDTVSRATTNHGLHRGSYQCTSEITKKDGTKLKVAYYTGAATGVLTNGETFSGSGCRSNRKHQWSKNSYPK